MFLGEELGSDVAFKKVLALILRRECQSVEGAQVRDSPDNAQGLIGGQGVPGPQARGLFR